jgi:hypothetical protein
MHINCRIPKQTGTLLLIGAMVGCGNSDLGSVEGTVRLNGQPLENARVTFTPVAGGRPAAGKTDNQGRYELIFSRDDKGALIGEHAVSISTFSEHLADDGETTEVVPEKVPARYNTNTELKAKVEGGANTLDFDLEPEGDIIQPVE